jgi:RNA polymerase sigma-70 factor (ECF subfamily)
MGKSPSDRAIWLARFVMPCELALRRWLGHHRLTGLDVDDVIQETYAILSGLKSVEDIRDPKRYAFQTAYSVILAQVRRSRIVSITTVADLDFVGAIADVPSPECQACDRDELRNVAQALSTLPQRVRDVLILRRVEGLSQREVAERLGITENTVEKCVARGVQALMSAFKRGGKAAPSTPHRKQERIAEDSSPDDPATSIRDKASL